MQLTSISCNFCFLSNLLAVWHKSHSALGPKMEASPDRERKSNRLTNNANNNSTFCFFPSALQPKKNERKYPYPYPYSVFRIPYPYVATINTINTVPTTTIKSNNKCNCNNNNNNNIKSHKSNPPIRVDGGFFCVFSVRFRKESEIFRNGGELFSGTGSWSW